MTDDTVMVPLRTAMREVVSYGATGTCQCGACCRAIDQYDGWCRHCGAKLVGTTYERVHA